MGKSEKQSVDMDTRKRLQHAVAAALDKKAIDLRVLEVAKLTTIADFFLICSGATERQTVAISEAMEDRLREKTQVKPALIEGMSPGRWILMDYGDFIAH